MKKTNLVLLFCISILQCPIQLRAMDQQVLRQKANEAKAWLAQNKGKVIALGVTVAAILGTAYLASQAQPKLKVIEVYKDKKVELPNDSDTRAALYRVGLLAYEKGADGLKELMKTPESARDFAVMLEAYTNLDTALAELAGGGVSAGQIRSLFYSKRNIQLEQMKQVDKKIVNQN